MANDAGTLVYAHEYIICTFMLWVANDAGAQVYWCLLMAPESKQVYWCLLIAPES